MSQYVMSQDSLNINDFGVMGISIGKNIGTINFVLPIDTLPERDLYSYDDDENYRIYVVRQDSLSRLKIQQLVTDILITTDSFGTIKAINIFFESEPDLLKKELTNKFGNIQAISESSVSNVRRRKTSLWSSNAKVEFSLSTNYFTLFGVPHNSNVLFIYPELMADTAGELMIFKK